MQKRHRMASGISREASSSRSSAPGNSATVPRTEIDVCRNGKRAVIRKMAPLATLHERIRSDIEERVLSGKWRPGDRVPSEQKLVEQYRCSRMTVNKALSSLVAAGLIVRRRRIGTVVARPQIQLVALRIPDIQAEIIARGRRYDYRLLSAHRRAPNRKNPAEVQLAAGSELYALECVHSGGGRPFALEDRLISLAAVPELPGIDFTQVSPGTWLFEHVAWTEARHKITAFNADEKTAQALAILPGAACLSLERETWRGRERITIVQQIFLGDEFELTAKFAPARA